MSLSLREKRNLYHSLAQLVRSGVTFPAALDKLVAATRGDARRLIETARRSLAEGHTVGEAFAAMPSLITPLEAAVVSAVEKSGHLERGLGELSQYFGAMHEARRGILKRCAYPIFLFHFAILMSNAVTAIISFMQNGTQHFLRDIGTAFFFTYGVVIILYLGISILRDISADNAILDRLLNYFPILGSIRRSFAMSRFCTVYGLQLDAGINVIDSVLTAGRSSRSGLVRSAVSSAVPEIRSGSQVGPLLAASGAFPTDLTQAVIVGEETGSLDDELRRLSADFRERAFSALQTFAEWFPKLVYIAATGYVGWKIVGLFLGYFKLIESLAQ